MFGKLSSERNEQNKIERPDVQNNRSQPNPNLLGEAPGEILLIINDHLPSMKDKAHSASVNQQFHSFFRLGIEEKAAQDAVEYVINPTKENVEKLKTLLKNCPALVLHPMIVKNRHGMVIKGTVYQIALHEVDNELIDDVIKSAFEKLHHGLEMMEDQRKAWLPEGWIEAEEKTCYAACKAIDDVFMAFKNASDPNHFTELKHEKPFTITINHPGAKEALEAFRKAVDSLYIPTNEVIKSGRDPIIKLFELVIDRYEENYDAFGDYESMRNKTLMRAVFGYCQRKAPINFMQAFAMQIYLAVEGKKLIRSFEYRDWNKHFILPLDSKPNFRLGYEYFVGGPLGVILNGCLGLAAFECGPLFIKEFLSIKNRGYKKPVLCTTTQLRTLNSLNL